MNSKDILFDRTDGIATITLNRPDVLNAMQPQNFLDVDRLALQAEKDDAIGVIILTGTGECAFCTGADLGGGIQKVTGAEGLEVVIPDPSRRFFSEITKPIIAAVNGVCVAGGMEMLLGTDLRVAAEHATFGITEARWGLIACGGGVSRIARQIPWARAMEMALLGATIGAQEALGIGLINRVVKPGELMETCREMAARIMRNGPLAVRKAKETIVQTHTMAWPDAFRFEYEAGRAIMASEDAKEGPNAFLEKRTPSFKGR